MCVWGGEGVQVENFIVIIIDSNAVIGSNSEIRVQCAHFLPTFGKMIPLPLLIWKVDIIMEAPMC